MITGKEALMCSLLHCGIDDLDLLDNIEYDFDDVLKRIGWQTLRANEIDINDIIMAAFDIGKSNIAYTIEWKIKYREQLGLTDDDVEKLKLLDPYEDICSYHNYLDTSVRFERNAEIYHELLKDSLDAFYERTGYEIQD